MYIKLHPSLTDWESDKLKIYIHIHPNVNIFSIQKNSLKKPHFLLEGCTFYALNQQKKDMTPNAPYN